MTSALTGAIKEAAVRTWKAVAVRSDLSFDDVRRRIDDMARWLIAELSPASARPAVAPPQIAREYVDLFRSALLGQLATARVVNGREVVLALTKLDELTATWKQTSRGQFLSRLTGAESADAVVAIAHDIRSPLTSIVLLVDSLRRWPAVVADPVRGRQLSIIHGAARGLSSLADDLIDSARREQLSMGPAGPFSVTETMEAVVEILLPMCEERALSLRVQRPTVDARIGHAAALHRILLNLVSNALRCTDAGYVSIECVEVSETTLEFSVTDTGVGISPDMLNGLTSGFSQNGPMLRFSRAGLGLATVRSLLAAMDSTLGVQSEEGHGTRFFFRLEMPPIV
jgi:signal transduction histidine kinase